MTVRYRLLSPVLFLGFFLTTANVSAQTGAELVQEKCIACHSVSPLKLTEPGRMEQKGPALGYAGTKYRRDWIVKWLQEPTRIRPGGMFAGNHTVVTDEGDFIDDKTLSEHITVSSEEAIGIADYLMTLTANPDLVTNGEYTPKKVSHKMAAMNFNKFKGCSSCHQDQEGIGGVSGPELYSAYTRLNPDFIVSFIRNPVAWDDISLMPHIELKDKEIYKLVHYLKLISGEKQ
ncbi:MAG: c-type cytochrome [Sneathiella sp.]|nr:c-type cytochrome [Sneathiella sp.]